MPLPFGRHFWLHGLMWGVGPGAKYASKVRLWSSWFCMKGGAPHAFLRSRYAPANLNPEADNVEQAIPQFRNHFLACIVILIGDGKGMQAIWGEGGSKCWLCKDHNGIVEQKEVGSTSRLGALLRSITLERRPGDYQHAACQIVNGKRTIIPPFPPYSPESLIKPKLLQLCRPSNKPSRMQTSGIPVGECLPSASRA